MRGVRSLSGLAGANASLKDAGAGGGPGASEVVGSWAYTDSSVSQPDVDLSGIDIQKGDTAFIFCTSYYEEPDDAYRLFTESDGYCRIFHTVMVSGQSSFAGSCYVRSLDGTETTLVKSQSIGFGTMIVAVVVRNAKNPVHDFSQSSEQAPSVANAEGDLILCAGFDRLSFDASFAPPAGYDLLGSGQNTAASNDPCVYVYGKGNAPANEVPGPPTWSNTSNSAAATVAV